MMAISCCINSKFARSPYVFKALAIWFKLLPNLPISLAIDWRVTLSNLGATNRAPCALFLTNEGTLIFKVSADACNFEYSNSLTRKLICFGSLRSGFWLFPTASFPSVIGLRSLTIPRRFLTKDTLFRSLYYNIIQSSSHRLRGLASNGNGSHFVPRYPACWWMNPPSPL